MAFTFQLRKLIDLHIGSETDTEKSAPCCVFPFSHLSAEKKSERPSVPVEWRRKLSFLYCGGNKGKSSFFVVVSARSSVGTMREWW